MAPLDPSGMLTSTQPGARVASLRILVVEDDDDAREVMGEVLCGTGRGLLIALAGTAYEGLQKLRRERFDLIVTDVGLPGASGLEMLDRARVEGLISATTTIMVCSANEEFRPQAIARGAIFRLKPLEVEHLVELTLRAGPAPP